MTRSTDLLGDLAFKINLYDRRKACEGSYKYYLQGAPGVAGDPRVDPVLALGTYLLVWGEGSGYLFCPFNAADGGRFEMRPDVPMNDGAFLDALRLSFQEAGVDTCRFFRTHSFKKGGVPLLKSLGVPDSEINDRGFWESDAA